LCEIILPEYARQSDFDNTLALFKGGASPITGTIVKAGKGSTRY
jgi:hypothetical protein